MVVLGEIADADTIDTAIKGAETGHLVIATMPTPDVVTTIERILTTLPREEREIGRMRLSEALRADRLPAAPAAEGREGPGAGGRGAGRHAGRPRVPQGCRARLGELRSIMADGRKQLGTQTFEQHLADLVEAGLITAETAKAALSLSAPARAIRPRRAEAGRLRLSRPAMPTLDDTMRQVLALRARGRHARRRRGPRPRRRASRGARATGSSVQRFAFAPSSLNGFPAVRRRPRRRWRCCCCRCSPAPGAPGWAALCVLAGGLGAARASLAVGIGLGWLPLGGAAREDANLIATRGDAPVRRWIVAHLDTKAQVQSMAGRLVAVWVIGLAVAVLMALALARLAGPRRRCAGRRWGRASRSWRARWPGRGRLRGTSPGARDNGTGVAAALAAAEALGRCAAPAS